jgi:hypothetical protein
MAHKGHRAKRHFIPKTTGGKIGLIFKVIGGVVIAGPAISTFADDLAKNDFASLPNDLLFAYTGLGGTTTINTTQTIKGIGSVAGGLGLVYLGKFLARAIH